MRTNGTTSVASCSTRRSQVSARTTRDGLSGGTRQQPTRRVRTTPRSLLRANPRPVGSVGIVEDIRFCVAGDGVRLAYATRGRGPAIVKTAHWMTHLEHDRQSPVWRHWLRDIGEGRQLVRYDGRGCGLSDRYPEDVSLDAFVADLEAVVDAAGLEHFALLGASQGGPIAIRYALRHPDRVSHLVLYGTYARGRARRALSAEERDEGDLLASLVRVGWGRADPAFRRVFTSRFVPDATPQQMEWFDELQRLSATPEAATRLRAVWSDIDVHDGLADMQPPTLVAHVRGDAVVPFEEGRMLASHIPRARLIALPGRNHILLENDSGWPVFVDELRRFIGQTGRPDHGGMEELSARELEVLQLVATGSSNEEIAEQLVLSVRTVERHLSNSYAKLRVSGRSARVAAAARVARRADG